MFLKFTRDIHIKIKIKITRTKPFLLKIKQIWIFFVKLMKLLKNLNDNPNTGKMIIRRRKLNSKWYLKADLKWMKWLAAENLRFLLSLSSILVPTMLIVTLVFLQKRSRFKKENLVWVVMMKFSERMNKVKWNSKTAPKRKIKTRRNETKTRVRKLKALPLFLTSTF